MNSASVDLIYLDPPFNSKRTYSAPIGSKAAGASFRDFWTFDDVDRVWLALQQRDNPTLYHVVEAARLARGSGMAAYIGMMAQRLYEMKRLLREGGSIYLHCDPTASHYIKMTMDLVFGWQNFKNEIVWKRTSSKNLSARQYARNHDTLLFCGGSTWNPQYQAYDAEYVERSFKRKGRYGRFDTADLTGGKQGGGTAYDPFRGVNPPPGRAWVPPPRDRFPAEAPIPDNYEELDQLAKCEALDSAGLIYWSSRGKPRYKKYLSTMKGVLAGDLVLDIPPIQSHAKERVGYPTQKPLALLRRIIAASSNEGDVVLDPFCGCATTCVAAEELGRQWAGIDISHKAAELVRVRLQQAVDESAGIVPTLPDVIHRTDLLRRTDMGKLPRYTAHKDALYGESGGYCGGCNVHFEKRNLTVDHIVPRSKGGTDHPENLWLLCGACNSSKGTKSQAEFIRDRMSLQGVGVQWLDQ